MNVFATTGEDDEERDALRPTRSLAARFEMLLDLYAPLVEREDGVTERDPSLGMITLDELRGFLEEELDRGEAP